MGTSDDSGPDNTPLVHEGWDNIKEKRRSCTDCLCLLFLLIAWALMTLIGLAVIGIINIPQIPKGDPYRLVFPMDYNGRLCGFDSSMSAKPYGYYLPDKTLVCTDSCPTSISLKNFNCKDGYQEIANASPLLGLAYTSTDDCFFFIPTNPILYRCVPDLQAIAKSGVTLPTAVPVADSMDSGTNYLTTFVGNVWTLRVWIFSFGLGASALIGFAYLYFLRIPGLLFIIIWSMLLSVLALLLALAVLLLLLKYKWDADGLHSALEVKVVEIASYVVFGIAALYICILIVLAKRIQLAIGVVKEAAKAMAAMPLLTFIPIIQVIGCVAFLVPWVYYMLYIVSSGNIVLMQGSYTNQLGITTKYQYRQMVYDDNTRYAALYLLFCWYWSSEFLVACGQLTIALSIVAWYFNRNKHNLIGGVGNTTVLWSACTVTRYHLGTASFGALLIAIVKTIRAVIAYIQKQAKKSGNKLLEYAMCCLQCCMYCLEKCMKFLNKNAYIQTAIYGYSFCKAARVAFFLILRNILRVSAVNLVADFVLLLGKLFICSLTTFILFTCLAYIKTPEVSEASGIIVPIIFAFVISYGVATMFCEIFGMAIETILCCFIADEEMFPPEKRFAEGGLKNTLQKAAEKRAAAAAAKGGGDGDAGTGGQPVKALQVRQIKVHPKIVDSHHEDHVGHLRAQPEGEVLL